MINSLALLFLATTASGSQFEVKMIDRLQQCSRGTMTEAVRTALLALATREEIPCNLPELTSIPPLFTAYPALQKTVSYVPLGVYPTPVKFCAQLSGQQLGVILFVKEDGKAGPERNGRKLFSGNKLRKLEFLLADAQAHGCTEVITRGGTGSNHALATTIYARELGMRSVCALGHQPNARSVRRALLLQHHYGATVRIPGEGETTYDLMKEEFIDFHKASAPDAKNIKRFPYVIPTGGSCDRGALGFVNAAFELKKQIDEGVLKTPDIIFVAVGVGSGGTTAGLLLGLQAAGLKCQLVCVATQPIESAEPVVQQTRRLFEETNTLLIENDPSFPRFVFPQEQFTCIKEFGGTGYGLYTKEGMAAKELLERTEKIILDGTYTAKAFAAVLKYANQQPVKGKTILFWNTYCGDDFSDLIKDADYTELPVAAHRYFLEDVQELDK
jgi:D-cysteine desulfhydrase